MVGTIPAPAVVEMAEVENNMDPINNVAHHLAHGNMSYWQHLRRAWTIAGILLVHGILPNVWERRASDALCKAPKRG
jgi:hypothetical protein